MINTKSPPPPFAEQKILEVEKLIINKQKINEQKPLLILITGGAASGKTTLTKQIKNSLEQDQTLTLSIDAYYSFSPLLFHLRNPNLQEIFQWEELNKDLELLLAGKSIHSPTYDSNHQFKRTNTLINSAPVIIIEGIFTLFHEEIRNKANLKIYLEIDSDSRLVRRLKRYEQGLKEGKFNKPIEEEIARYTNYVKKNHENYVEPTKMYADLIVNNNFEGGAERVVKVIEEIREKREKLEN
jgi:uridine kinase